MTPERWRAITSIFHAALARRPADRPRFVAARCGHDGGLQRDVAAMLSAHADVDALGGTRQIVPAVTAGAGSTVTIDRSATEQSVSPAPRTPMLEPGRLVAGRYRITQLIGRGGMGEVYESHDEVADDIVALKVAHTSDESLDTLAARWRRELQLARKVTHPGVCRVHDVAIDCNGERELLLLTMERVQGESLRARLSRDALTVDEAVGIVRQVAEALDAAHAQGVLHRDVKPDNILLEPIEDQKTRVVLTDFGLARHVTGVDTLTETGRVAGTLGYLAPELLRGEAPSAKSDLYALAVVARAVLTRALPELTPPVQAVLDRAQSAEPSLRFDSAVAFVTALTPAVQPVTPSWRRRTGRYAAVAALLVVVAASAAAIRAFQAAPTAIAPASQVLLTELVNGTSDPELDGAGEALRSQLAQSTHFELLEADRVRALLQQMGRVDAGTSTPEVAREVALRAGVPLVVFAALTRLGTDYTMSVKIEQVGSRPSFARRSWTRTFEAPTKAGLLESMRDAAVWIRQSSGEMPAALDDQDRAVADVSTSSWEALRLFKQAGDLQAAGRVQDATLVLQQAVRIDPDFAMAHTRLGDYLMSLRRDKEGFTAWQQAIAAAERRQLSNREALRIRGQYLDDAGDLAGAERAYRTYAVHYPNDPYAAFFLGISLRVLNRAEEAVPWLERTLQLRPGWFVGAVHLAQTYLELGRTVDAERTIAYVDSLGAPEWATWLRALSVFAALRPEDALATLAPLQASDDPQWRSRVYLIRASWLSEVGREGEALAELRAGIQHDTSEGLRDRLADKWLHVAELQRRAGDPETRMSVYRALETASNAHRLHGAVSILVRAGNRVDAERLMSRFDDLAEVPLTIAARDRALSELALADGDAHSAVAAIERTLASTRNWESRLTFAEALARAGDLARAEQVLRVMVDRPATIYGIPELQGPGLWRRATASLAEIVGRRDSASAADIRQRFAPILVQAAVVIGQ